MAGPHELRSNPSLVAEDQIFSASPVIPPLHDGGAQSDLPSAQGGSTSEPQTFQSANMEQNPAGVETRSAAEVKLANEDLTGSKPSPRGLRPAGSSTKLGTLSGVYIPTCLNVLSILMFLRFGFLLGQAGVLGMMGMLIASYAIGLTTTFSLSAIASNGTVRGGGAYYLISRSLGPEFGGSIGVVFYMGLVFNTGMNAVGLINCITLNFGSISGNWSNVLPESRWYLYLWSSSALALCIVICLLGSAIFARAGKGLLVILLISTLSIPLSAIIMSPFEDREWGIQYTGLSLKTFLSNLKPQLTKGAAGSHLNGVENFQDLFGVLFPATSGIFAGASMSGDLKHPSKAIPKGTIYGLGTTFVLYTLVIFAMAGTTTRSSLLRNSNVIQDINVSGLVILAGELATSFFSTLMGVVSSSKLLQALARDRLLPGLSIFGQGTKHGDEPTYAILITYFVVQITMLCDLNQIASFVTMAYLMTFLVMNLACFLLKISSAPNFRPSFHFFNWQTAFAGAISSGAAMFFVDGVYATVCVGILIVIFMIIHYTGPPKSWGDVSQSLIYHQVRKYLLRLKEEHVKFWRPQILLFVNDPRRQYRLIQFCNSMKKGGLYILGHVIVTDDFGGSVPEARRQQAAWTKYIDFSKIKAFVNISISPQLEWGSRNILMSAGLGGMRPNIVVMGMYNLDDLRRSKPLIDVSDIPKDAPDTTEAQQPRKRHRGYSHAGNMEEVLPTDSCKPEGMMNVTSYVTVLEDLLWRLQINVAIAKGFHNLELPDKKRQDAKKYIDLWPIQMSAEISGEGNDKQSVLTSNFDTYTLILQLGAILNTVPSWKAAYKLRVAVFVEYESDVQEEQGRVKSLLEKLRIEAEVVVFWLASGNLPTYEVVVNGTNPGKEYQDGVDEALKGQEWWDELQSMRGKGAGSSATQDLADIANIFATGPRWPDSSPQQGPQGDMTQRFLGLQKSLKKRKRRLTMQRLSKLGVNLGMRTSQLSQNVGSQHASHGSGSEDSEIDSSDSSGSDDDDSSSLGGRPESVVSEGDLGEFGSETESPPNESNFTVRRKSHGDSMRVARPSKKPTSGFDTRRISKSRKRPLLTQQTTTVSASSIPSTSPPDLLAEMDSSKGSGAYPSFGALLKPESEASPSASRPSSQHGPTLKSPTSPGEPSSSSQVRFLAPQRPALSRHSSTPKFSSKPVPITRVSSDDGPGRSIMFTYTPSPPRPSHNLASAHGSKSPAAPQESEVFVSENETYSSRQGSPYSTQAVPISFNDLPSRAQHLILNELMRQESGDTAVVFTTLPGPAEGTSQSEEQSADYLAGLELLCRDLPPILMVHSNNMTVTMSL